LPIPIWFPPTSPPMPNVTMPVDTSATEPRLTVVIDSQARHIIGIFYGPPGSNGEEEIGHRVVPSPVRGVADPMVAPAHSQTPEPKP